MFPSKDECVSDVPPQLDKDRRLLFSELKAQAGSTRLIEFTTIEVPNGNRIFGKAEFENPSGSLYDRVYPTLLGTAEEEGYIIPGKTPLIEASTGNAGAAFARACKHLGYHDYSVITHEDTPRARVLQIESYGANVVFSPPGLAAMGYVKLLEELLERDRINKGGKLGSNPFRLFCPTKISDKAKALYYPIVEELEGGLSRVDYFLGVVGSGGSLSGIGKRLKQLNPDTRVYAVDPIESPTTMSFVKDRKVLQFEKFPHELWGAATFGLPLEKLNLDIDIVDDVVLVSSDEWRSGCQILAQKEGLAVGRTTGAVLVKSLQLAQKVHNRNFLIMLYDPHWKYEDDYPYIK